MKNFVVATVFCAVFMFVPVHAEDRYASFTELASSTVYGTDYAIAVEDRASAVTVFAPHGGLLEPGTDVIAKNCAGADWNLFVLTALSSATAKDMHVTAANFDEPRSLALAGRSTVGVGVHDQRDKGPVICVGGGNVVLRAQVGKALAKDGFTVEQPCRRLRGESPLNIVNRARKKGVQFELSEGISKELEANAALRERFCAAVRAAVTDYLKKAANDFNPPRVGQSKSRHY